MKSKIVISLAVVIIGIAAFSRILYVSAQEATPSENVETNELRPEVSTTIVISQAYGGGGGSTGTYINDYVELKNISTSPQSLSGLSLMYGSATGQFGSSSSNIFALSSTATIQPGKYYLVQLSAAGSGGAAFPVTPDEATTNLSMAAASGKVALVNSTIAGNSCGATATPCTLPNAGIIDLVSWGAANNAEGGAPTNGGAALTSTQGNVRKTAGCTETDNNNSDFDVATAPVPRNSATTAAPCSGSSTTLPKLFKAIMKGSNEVPANASTGRGFGRLSLNASEDTITASFYWNNLTSPSSIGHIHGAAIVGVNAPILFDMQPTAGLTTGSVIDRTFTVTPAQVADLKAGLWYFNVHTTAFPGGEIRGQILASPTNADFNGDGKTDLGVVRTEGIDLMWYVNNLSTGTSADTRIQQFGAIGDTPQAADYDGDGKTDIAVWRPGAPNVGSFFILQSSTNTVRTEVFGITGDDATVSGDYDGDGKADVAVYRPGVTGATQAYFFYRPSTVGGTSVSYNPWGNVGDVPAPGDYDGDGRADFVIKRNNGGQAQFWRRMTTSGVDIQNFGLATDTIVPGDYDGDGRTDLAVARVENVRLIWYYKPSATPLTSFVVLGAWGVPGDQFAQGDYDGDGRTDQAIFRPNPDPNQNFFWVNRTTSGFLVSEWGANGDKAVASYNSH